MNWTLDCFYPAQGELHGKDPIDHQAWLKATAAAGGESIYVSLHMSSRGVPDAHAKELLDAMVSGLNAASK